MGKEVKTDLEESNIILPKIPFYGVSGTISHIEESLECYYKVVYREDGSINPLKLPVPKKRGRNFILIEEEYYNEVEKYLLSAKDKYLEYRDNKYIGTFGNKQFFLLVFITSLASIFSLSFFFTTAIMGVIFESISVLALYIICDIHKRDICKLKESSSFVEKYQSLASKLGNYNEKMDVSLEDIRKIDFLKIDEKKSFKYNSLSNVKLLTKGREVA